MSEGEQVRARLRELGQKAIPPRDFEALITAIEKGTHVPDIRDEELEAALLGGIPRKEMLWKALKVERNAYIASELPHIWKKVKTFKKEAESTCSSSVYHDDAVAPQHFNDARDFQNLMYILWNRALMRWNTEREEALKKPEEEWTPRDKAYVRFKRVLNLTHESDPQDPTLFITRGVGTATETAWGLIQLVPEVARRDGITLTDRQMSNSVWSAYVPIIATISSLNLEIGPDLLRGLQEPDEFTFKLEPFKLVRKKRGGMYHLIFDHSVLYDIKDENGVPVLSKDPKSETPMCPARYTKVMKEYLEWSLQLARKHYFPHRRRPGEPTAVVTN